MKLLKWLIKMAKKLLNLNTDDGALSFEDSASLPSGTVNKLLRHNSTDWVATVNSTLTDGNTDVEFKMVNNALPEKKYIQTYLTNAISGLLLVSDKSTESFKRYITANTSESITKITLNTNTNEYITCYADDTNKRITLKPLASNESQTITLSSTKTYSATTKFLEFYGRFAIYQDGKIVSNYLSGTGSATLEATADGTIQRSATALTKTKIINRVLTSASSIHSFDNTDLGIAGDLTTKIFSFELLRKISGNDYFSLGELVQTDKTLTSGAVTFATGEIPSGDTIRLAITYID